MPLLYGPKAYEELRHSSTVDAFHSEAFLETAVHEWLFTPVSDHGPLNKLAVALEANQNDFWLKDFLNSRSSPHSLNLLRQAILSNYSGDPEAAAAFAAQAIKTFCSLRNMAGVARSRFELLFALHRQAKTKLCNREALGLSRYIQGRHYSWLEIQISLERAICEGMMNKFDHASALVDLAEDKARQSHYQGLALRAIGVRASLFTATGRLREAWQAEEEGLQVFWEAPYAPERGHQFYSDLEFAAEATGQWEIAVPLEQEAISVLEDSKHLDFKASAHFQLAKAEEMLGQQNVAREEFKTAEVLFDQLPRNRATRMYEANVQVSLAAVEADLNALASAAKRLDEMGDIAQFHNFIIQLGYWKARAAVARQTGNGTEEQADLAQAVLIGNRGFETLHTEQDRWNWRREVGTAYQRLLELEVSAPHDPVQALADWEHFRSVDALGIFSGPTVHNIEARSRLLRIMSSFADASLITFAVFPSGTKVWIADNRGIKEFALPKSRVLMDDFSAFAKACSDRNVPLSQVRDFGRRAYDRFIAPLRGSLDPRRTLFFEADQFSGIPWAALVMPNGEYFGVAHRIVNVPGVFYGVKKSFKARLAEVEQALIVVPATVTFDGQRYPPLPQTEAEIQAVQRAFPQSVPLQGQDANISKVLRQLSAVAVFHFAGHALSREYGGELLLSGTESPAISAATISRMRLKRMKLAVLAACSTAKTEGEAPRDPNGLVRAFLKAGAETVIASRWDADSKATEDFMERFYDSLSRGNSIASAIQKARDHVREQKDWAHPYYWAVFDIFALPAR